MLSPVTLIVWPEIRSVPGYLWKLAIGSFGNSCAAVWRVQPIKPVFTARDATNERRMAMGDVWCTGRDVAGTVCKDAQLRKKGDKTIVTTDQVYGQAGW